MYLIWVKARSYKKYCQQKQVLYLFVAKKGNARTWPESRIGLILATVVILIYPYRRRRPLKRELKVGGGLLKIFCACGGSRWLNLPHQKAEEGRKPRPEQKA